MNQPSDQLGLFVKAVASEIEGEKLGASVLFFDFGITDAITDKHRRYQGNVVIPVQKTGG